MGLVEPLVPNSSLNRCEMNDCGTTLPWPSGWNSFTNLGKLGLVEPLVQTPALNMLDSGLEAFSPAHECCIDYHEDFDNHAGSYKALTSKQWYKIPIIQHGSPPSHTLWRNKPSLDEGTILYGMSRPHCCVAVRPSTIDGKQVLPAIRSLWFPLLARRVHPGNSMRGLMVSK